MTFPNDFLNKIICGDAVSIMQQIPDQTLDLCVTSPPYNLRNSTGGGMFPHNVGKWDTAALNHGYATHSDDLPYADYVTWQRACLTEMMRTLKETGAIFYNHKWRVQAGLIQDRREIVDGFPIRQIIIWQRKGGINFNPYYFLPTYEVIYLIAKPKFKLLSKANAVGDVWTIQQEMSNPHPAPYPVELTDRIVGAVDAQSVLDPFMGSGTTAVSCKKLNRSYIGIEKDPSYCEMAEERLTMGEKAWQAVQEQTRKEKRRKKRDQGLNGRNLTVPGNRQ